MNTPIFYIFSLISYLCAKFFTFDFIMIKLSIFFFFLIAPHETKDSITNQLHLHAILNYLIVAKYWINKKLSLILIRSRGNIKSTEFKARFWFCFNYLKKMFFFSKQLNNNNTVLLKKIILVLWIHENLKFRLQNSF